MTIYFAPIGSGIGDVVVCLPICKWLIENHDEPVMLVARGPRQETLSSLIPGIGGEVIEPNLKEAMKNGDRLVNLRDHPLQRHHDWFSNEFQLSHPQFYIQDILSKICHDMGMPVDLSKIESLSFEPDERARGKVLLVPGSTMKAKMIDPKVWLSLYTNLKEQGIESLMLGLPERNKEIEILKDLGIPHIATHDLAQTINIISVADAMVSVDTGLMHIGVQQGIKTIAIYGQCQVYHRPTKNCLPIFTNKKLLEGSTSAPETPATELDYPTLMSTWNWHPKGANDGEYLCFEDHRQIIRLLC